MLLRLAGLLANNQFNGKKVLFATEARSHFVHVTFYHVHFFVAASRARSLHAATKPGLTNYLEQKNGRE